MKFDLKTPCRNCPFRSDETRIVFQCRERAQEIAEIAYRKGFVCHLSGETRETFDGEEYFDFAENSQHCAGALIIFIREGCGPVPFEWLDENEQDEITARLDFDAPVFETEEDFIEANKQDC